MRVDAPVTTKHIHILGTGSIGCLIAHSLASLPAEIRPQVTLLLHRPGLWDDYDARGRQIHLTRIFEANAERHGRGGFGVEVLTHPSDQMWELKQTPQGSNNSAHDDSIDSLVVTVKGAATKAALQSVRRRLQGSTSTVLLLQNGMGQIDDLNKQVFDNPDDRPRYMQGIISHGLFLKQSFDAIHAGSSDMQVGMAPTAGAIEAEENDLWSPSSIFLADTLRQCPELKMTIKSSTEVLSTQLMKLAVNAVNNPLTGILDILNGRQLDNPIISSNIIPPLVAEISHIILSLPEMSSDKVGNDVRQRFELAALEPFTRNMIRVNEHNSSSMREDTRKRKQTEVKYINGYLVKRGKEVGVDVTMNELILNLMEAKTMELQREAS